MHRFPTTFRSAFLIFTMAGLLTGSAGAELGDVLLSFPCAAGTSTSDLAWVDGILYQEIYNPIEERNIYRMDPETGEVLGVVPYAGESPHGLAYDGHNLWQGDYPNDVLYKLDPLTGAIRDSFPAPGGTEGQHLGIGWDGEWLWIADTHGPEKIWKVDTLGVVHGQIPAPGDSPFGLAWGAGFIWVSNNVLGGAPATIYKLDPETGDVLDSFLCPDGGGAPNGITHDGEYLWIAVNTNDMIYKVDDGITSSSVEGSMPGEHQRLRMQSLRADRAARAIDLQLELRERGELRVQLLDMLGRLSAPALMHRADAGPCHLRLSTAGMNSGIFYVRVSCGNAVESGKVLIMR
jgi:streptogramin lyase